MRDLLGSSLAILCLAFGSAAFAQESAATYPSKPIRIIVTFPAGGPTDFVARAVGQSLSEAWGQPVVVDNRPGAGGNIGMNIAAKAPPDGYTLVLSSFGPMVISPFVYSSLPYDPIRDLTPITLAATNPFFLVVRPSLPATRQCASRPAGHHAGVPLDSGRLKAKYEACVRRYLTREQMDEFYGSVRSLEQAGSIRELANHIATARSRSV